MSGIDKKEMGPMLARFAAHTLLNAIDFYCDGDSLATRAAFARALRRHLSDAEYTVLMDALMTVDVMRSSRKGVKE